jgi:hypothetical protein
MARDYRVLIQPDVLDRFVELLTGESPDSARSITTAFDEFMRLLDVEPRTQPSALPPSAMFEQISMLPEIEIRISPLMFAIKIDHSHRFVSVEYIRFYREPR